MGEDQGLLGPQPIPAVVPSAVQFQFFYATSGFPSVGHISPMYLQALSGFALTYKYLVRTIVSKLDVYRGTHMAQRPFLAAISDLNARHILCRDAIQS
jgi:hypothetical protein